MKRVMVTGSRDWRDVHVIHKALWNAAPREARLVHGCASGADAIARALSLGMGWAEPEDFWPDYHLYGFAEANKIRNVAMVDSKPDLILAFPTRGSRGTWHAVRTATDRGYVKGETLFIYNEQKEIRQSKDVSDFPVTGPQ